MPRQHPILLTLKTRLSEDEIPNPMSVVKCCMGLVAIDPMTTAVTMAHFDIAQHMRAHWEEIFSWEEKLMLANITLAYLLMDAFSTGPCRQVDAFIRRLESHPFLDYASRHWGHHAHDALLLQVADAAEGKCSLTENVNRLLNDRPNLDSSLQVCDLNSRSSKARELFLRNNEKDFTVYADKFSSISTLQVATRFGFSAIARETIDIYPSMVSDQDDFGTSPLHEAAQAGRDDLAEMLLKTGAPSSPRNKEDKTPLYFAVLNGNTRIISMLSSQKFKIGLQSELPRLSDIVDGQDKTLPALGDLLECEEAFCDAAETGKLDVIVRLLKDYKSLANSKKHGKVAIIYAIHGGHEKIVEAMLRAGASLSCPEFSPSDCIPLHQAVKNSNLNMISMFLDYGANTETRDEFGRTALFEILGCHDLDGAFLLLDHAANIHSRDNRENTILHEAVSRGAFEQAQLFIDLDMGLDYCNEEGLTPLHLTAQYNHCRIARNLLQNGADTDFPDQRIGWTALMFPASKGFLDMCQILLSHGADVAKVSFDDKTSLIIATEADHYEVVRLLLESGAKANDQSTGASTPLLLAATAGHAQLVRLLLNHGADIDAVDNESNSALTLAANTGHTRTVQILLEHKADLATP